MDLEIELRKRIDLVDNYLEKQMPSGHITPTSIHEAMRYSLFAGGKRLRPVLVMAAAEALGGQAEKVLPMASAFELIHTYSLIHDDLPAMDNDDYRRGKLTNHKVYGEAIAILAGDGLLTLAFQLALKNHSEVGLEPQTVLLAMQEMAEAAGSKGMIGGQVVDMESEDKTISPELMEYIHSHKTGALFRASVRCGAILAGATNSQLAALTIYAEELGLAFQIVDDILDIVGDEAKLGKKVGSDVANNKSTYPTIYGLENSKIMAQKAIDEAVGALSEFGQAAEFLRQIAFYMTKREC